MRVEYIHFFVIQLCMSWLHQIYYNQPGLHFNSVSATVYIYLGLSHNYQKALYIVK